MKQILFFICCAVLMTACKKDENNDTPTVAQRTVMVYMSGDNNLSGIVSEDIREMQQGITGIPQNNNLVVFIDRAISNEKPFIARVTKEAKLDTLYKYPYDFYASDPELFGEVLQQITTLCPAKEYGLVLWGHATGWVVESDTIAQRRAYGVDNGQWMNITQMARALEGLKDQSVLPKLSFIFADCCNMMGAEVAYELRNHADYLIGSPAEIPGFGAPYHKIVKYLFSQSDNFYEGIIDEYANTYSNYLPLSVIRLSEMEQLASATKAVLPAVAEHLKQGDDVATKGIIYYYSPNGRYDNINKTMYDMNDMIRTALLEQPEAYETWHQALLQAVPKRVTAPMWETMNTNTVNFNDFTVTDAKQGCVSMFFPLDLYYAKTCLYTYNTDIKNMQWYQAVGWSSVGY